MMDFVDYINFFVFNPDDPNSEIYVAVCGLVSI